MAKKASITEFQVDEDTKFVSAASFLGGIDDDQPAETDDDDDEPLLGEDTSTIATDLQDDDPEDDDAEVEADADTTNDTEDEEFSFAPIAADFIEGGVWELPEGKKLEDYDDSPEGMREMAQDAGKVIIQKAIAALPPTAQRIVDLAMKGGQEEDLQKLLTLEDSVDWAEADLDEEDDQKAIVEEAMRLRDPDLSDEEIAEELADLEDLGKLAKQAGKDQKFLIKHQDAEKAEVEKVVAKREQEAVAAYEESVTQIRNYITEQKEIAGLELTKADREGFMAYLTVKDKAGLTQADKMNTPERRIQKEFLNYKNFNLTKLKREAITEATKDMKKNLGRYNPSARRTTEAGRPDNMEGLSGKIVSPQQYLSSL